jgi:hypothetical protein
MRTAGAANIRFRFMATQPSACDCQQLGTSH